MVSIIMTAKNTIIVIMMIVKLVKYYLLLMAVTILKVHLLHLLAVK